MELRDYQHDACRAAWEFLCGQRGNPVVCLPTGAGKSLVIAQLCHDATTRFGGRVLVLAHRKELLVQNAAKIKAVCPDLDIGVYSAGLSSRDVDHTVVCGGIQSVFRRAHEFGSRQLVIIDEVHLVPHSDDGMYNQFLGDLQSINPHMRMIGTTATPYRLDCGPLCRPDALFQKVCYSAPIRRLINQGWLCNLTTAAADRTVDTSGIHLRGGEFIPGEAERLFNLVSVVDSACQEIVAKSVGRKSILVFCSGVLHADHVADKLRALTGEEVGVVTGETLPLERAGTLGRFRDGSLRWCCNVDVLTTGFDAPNIDCIAVLRATMSPGLFAQIVGRGFRVHPGKNDCLVLDFGGNVRRHGPIDSDEYGVQDKRQRHPGEAAVKTCPNCQAEVLAGTIVCEGCGFRFREEQGDRHDGQADTAQILSEPEWWSVEAITYSFHQKRNREPGDKPSMRVSYECVKDGAGGNLAREIISEWICIEHTGFARRKAEAWWRTRSIADMPESVEEAVELGNRGAIAGARRIQTVRQGRWWRITQAELDDIPDEWLDEGEDPFTVFDREEVAF